HINFDEVFATLAEINYKGWLTIEAFSRNDPDFANAIGVWREFNQPWSIAEDGVAIIKSIVAKHQLNYTHKHLDNPNSYPNTYYEDFSFKQKSVSLFPGFVSRFFSLFPPTKE